MSNPFHGVKGIGEGTKIKQYAVVPFHTGFFSGALHPVKFEQFLNQHGAMGWRFVRSIHETRRIFLFFSREAHFCVFEREASLDDHFRSNSKLEL